MVKAATRIDIFWGYLAQLLNIGAGLILLPILLRYMSSEDVGLWFVFITLASFAQLLEFGFQPTLARTISYIYAGATSIVAYGLPPVPESGHEVNRLLLAQITSTSRFVYQIVSFATAVVLLIAGTYYISTLLVPSQPHNNVLLGWLSFALGFMITFYYGYFNALLQGRGDITQTYKVIILTRGSFLIIGAIFTVMGFGLLGLGIASLISCAVGRFAAHLFYFSPNHPESKIAFKLKTDGRVLVKLLLPNASRIGLVQIGAFLIHRTSILLVSSYIGLMATASYGMTITVLMALSSISNVVCQAQLPHMNALQLGNEKLKLQKIFCSSLVVGWLSYISGAILILIFGNRLLIIISSSTFFLPTGQLILFIAIFLLELNHTIAATYLTTINKIPFVSAAIVSGILITGINFILAPIFGVWGLIFTQGIIQLAYNNWRWPQLAMEHLNLNFISLMRFVFRGRLIL